MIRLKEMSLERSILIVVCGLCLIKVVHGLYLLYQYDLGQETAILYSGLLLITIASLVSAFYSKSIFLTSSIFGLVLTSLVICGYTNGGLVGLSKINLMALMVILIMVHRGMWSVVFGLFLYAVQMTLIWVWYSHYEWISDMVLPYFYNLTYYQTTVVIVAISFIYLSYRYGKESERQIIRERELSNRIEELEIENLKLEKQEIELKELNDLLNLKIDQRSKELTISNHSINSFMDFSVQEIAPSINHLAVKIDSLDSKSELATLLKASSNNLSTAFVDIKDKIDSNNW
ncbi:hypothetical protein [Reichenbachiella ulvae]|uniref:Uncharacterized protein n=1 Tax=Reichenbachiella ulvae TaxID=2980104 RepID=A0ABT3D129_9BACT|nr:hypothetical protein [Reichenbachiella ulvae]MCV9389536.1 hypothetical protein [Reichenbachiella ulvae]